VGPWDLKKSKGSGFKLTGVQVESPVVGPLPLSLTLGSSQHTTCLFVGTCCSASLKNNPNKNPCGLSLQPMLWVSSCQSLDFIFLALSVKFE
jgi:hypothetical protein